MPVTAFNNLLPHDALETGNGMSASRGVWGRWSSVVDRRYMLGIEEDVMLLDPQDHSLVPDSSAVLAQLSSRELGTTRPGQDERRRCGAGDRHPLGGFPWTGTPRRFGSYWEWLDAIAAQRPGLRRGARVPIREGSEHEWIHPCAG